MKRQITLGVLALVLVALRATGQNVTSFSDSSGDRVLYVASGAGGDYGGDIHEFWLYGTQPVDTDLTRWFSSEWAVYGSLTSYSDANGQHVFYIGGKDFHVHQLYWSFTSRNESDLDWTFLAGAPLALPGSNLTGFSNARGEHVYYSTSDSHVHHLYAMAAARPIHEDLTVKAGPASNCASLNSVLTSFSDGSTELVYYVGSSGHVCELGGWPQMSLVWNPFLRRWVQVSVWQESSFDLTAMAGGTPAIPGSPLTGFSDANGQHVFYLGTNQHVYQLCLSRSGAWSNPDLTAQFGRDPAAGDSLVSLSNASGEQVFYTDIYQQVVQINLTFGYYLFESPPTMPLNRGECQPGTSLATISSDAMGREDVYYIGQDQHVYNLQGSPTGTGVRWYVNGDQTAVHGGVPAGPQGFPLGWCLIG